jgi:hypothetical protein
MERANTFSLKLHFPPVGLSLLFLTAVAKNLETNTFKEDESVSIRGLLSNRQTSFKFLVMYVFLNGAKHSLSGLNSLTQFLFRGINFATFSKSSPFIRECRGLRFGEEL